MSLVVLTVSSSSLAEQLQLDFEDVFGAVAPNQRVNGPGDFDFGLLSLSTPDPLMFNIGHSGTQFSSDFLYFFTFDDGARFYFDTAIESIAFQHGQHFNIESASTFGLFVNDVQMSAFTHDPRPIDEEIAPADYFSFDFTTPVTEFVIRVIDEGATTGMGMDSLIVQTIPEPSSVLACAIGMNMLLRRWTGRVH